MRVWRIAALVFGLLVILQNAHYFYMASGWYEGGAVGYQLAETAGTNHFFRVDQVAPGGPAARAGIVSGDALRLDRWWERWRSLKRGEAIGASVRHGSQPRHVTLIAEPRRMFAPTYMITAIANGFVCLIAMLIVARAGNRRANLLLGLALLCLVVPGGYARLWQNAPLLFPVFFVFLNALLSTGPVLLLAALRDFRREAGGGGPRWLGRLFWLSAIAEGAALLVGAACAFTGDAVPGLGNGLNLQSLASSFGALLAPIALATGWRQVPFAARTRYAFMAAAIGVFSIFPAIDPVIMFTGNDYVSASWPVVIQISALIAGALMFAYAILRHRVIDLGFALNRTIVYSAVSFVVLLAFGVVEWGSEKLLPRESLEASALIDGGVALLLFLVLHRLHEWVEKAVERVLFHQWHAREEQLRHFVGQARFITRPEILLARAAEAFGRFTDGASIALYRKVEDGSDYASAETTARFDIDDPAIVALRAERVPLHDAFAPGDLIVPMVHRAEVIGFVAFGPKPNGEPYRLDEEALLADAVHGIGADLHALRVEELERRNAELAAHLRFAAPRLGVG